MSYATKMIASLKGERKSDKTLELCLYHKGR